MRAQHELAGQTVILNPQGSGSLTAELAGQQYTIEDWWENVAGMSWMEAQGNPACLKYAMRAGFAGLPIDNEVVYGKVGGLGHLVHVTELVPLMPQTKLTKEFVYRHARLVLDHELMVFVAQGHLDDVARLIADDLVGNWDTVLMAYEAGLVGSNDNQGEE